MLLLDTNTMEFEGITVFPDHADPQQFYYMPLAPHLTMRPDGAGAGHPQFSLIRFKGEAGTGGFVNFDVNLGLPPERAAALASAVQRMADLRDPPRLAPVPVVDGTVHLLMLGEDSSAEPEEGEEPAAGAIRFVETISHAASPSLYGDNQAAFSVQLTQEGVTTVLQSIEGEILPIAVVYSLEYLGLRPSYAVRLTIDWDRVQEHMDESFGANLLFVSTEIGKAVDELVEKKVIKFEADSFVDDSDADAGTIAGRRDAAIAQVRAMITDAFFQPSLPPWTNDKQQWSNDLQKAADVMSLIAGGPAAARTSKAMFSYKKMEYKRIDRKSLNVSFSERATVRRTIFPQGHLAGLFEALRAPGVDRGRFITDVNLDDPWFKRRRLEVSVHDYFENDRIDSINVRARYNGEPKNAILTKAAASHAFEWGGRLEGNTLSMPVELSYEVSFANVDATERPQSIVSPVKAEDAEVLRLNPRGFAEDTLYAIRAIPIRADSFPWERYPMVEAHLRYADPANGLMQTEVFHLTKEKPQDEWKLFLLDLTRPDFEQRIVYRGADHKDHETEWVVNETGDVPVRDPFPSKRELQVAVSADWTVYKRAFVDVVYKDEASGAQEQTSFEFKADDDGRKTAVFEMQDPMRRTLEYSALFMGLDGSSAEVPVSQTNANSIIVKPGMMGRRIVEVRPPADFAAQNLSRVTVDLVFEDLAGGIDTRSNMVFEPSGGPRFFEHAFADPSRAKYMRTIAYLFTNGMQKTVGPEASEDGLIQLKAP
ncbi:MAG: hypothetical protein H7X93_02880 [Sphingomonadaceae bacterium]|nr:hypothetical protein [Sphingomonadaceae bacterium]